MKKSIHGFGLVITIIIGLFIGLNGNHLLPTDTSSEVFDSYERLRSDNTHTTQKKVIKEASR